jgi:hypothetical protein
MQQFSGKIENGIESVCTTQLSLSNPIIEVLKMTTNNLPSKPKSIKICSVEGCERKFYGHGLCHLHWERKRYGIPFSKPIKKIAKGQTDREKFWSRVAVTADENDCWEWQGLIIGGRYGQVTFNKKRWSTHVYSFFLANGYKPTLCVLHSCDNMKCVNPKHLREGSSLENSQDKVARNRQTKGEASPQAKMTETKVIEARALSSKGFSIRRLAKLFGVNTKTMWQIVHRKTWKHVIP